MSWKAWDLDWLTVAWLVWIAAFFVLETIALLWFKGEELTAHLRPVFTTQDLSWFLAFGLWLWLGFHFLVDEVFV